MVVAMLVIAHGGHVHDTAHDVRGDYRGLACIVRVLAAGDRPCCRFEDGQGFAPVSPAHADDLVAGVIVDGDGAFQPAWTGDGTVDERTEVGVVKRFEFDDD